MEQQRPPDRRHLCPSTSTLQQSAPQAASATRSSLATMHIPHQIQLHNRLDKNQPGQRPGEGRAGGLADQLRKSIDMMAPLISGAGQGDEQDVLEAGIDVRGKGFRDVVDVADHHFPVAIAIADD